MRYKNLIILVSVVDGGNNPLIWSKGISISYFVKVGFALLFQEKLKDQSNIDPLWKFPVAHLSSQKQLLFTWKLLHKVILQLLF